MSTGSFSFDDAILDARVRVEMTTGTVHEGAVFAMYQPQGCFVVETPAGAPTQLSPTRPASAHSPDAAPGAQARRKAAQPISPSTRSTLRASRCSLPRRTPARRVAPSRCRSTRVRSNWQLRSARPTSSVK